MRRRLKGTFAGAVLVAKDGKPVFEQAYGLADRENHIPNYAEDAVSQRVDEQDVHGCGDIAAGAGG